MTQQINDVRKKIVLIGATSPTAEAIAAKVYRELESVREQKKTAHETAEEIKEQYLRTRIKELCDEAWDTNDGMPTIIEMIIVLGTDDDRYMISEMLKSVPRIPKYDFTQKILPALRRVLEHPNFNVPIQIPPSLYFISVGPGPIDTQYYSCIMYPSVSEPSGFGRLAKSNYGFDTAKEALYDAAKQFPSLPVLLPPDTYEYPYFDVSKARIFNKARERRDKRQEKLLKNFGEKK